MKRLHSFAVYALAAPVLTLGAGSLLAQPFGLETDQGEQSILLAERDGSQKASDHRQDQSRMQSRDQLESVPANGTQASNLIGSNVKTAGDEDIGSVSDLIIDENGQIVAIVVGVGGFLGMGEKDVAIGWDRVSQSGNFDEQELQVNVTRQYLRDALEFGQED